MASPELGKAKVGERLVTDCYQIGYRPELDTSPECSEEEMENYQSILGACQWMVSLGRYDINHAVMSMSRFRAMPHLEAIVHLDGYIRRFPNAAIRFRTGIPDHEKNFGEPKHFSWMETPYGDAKEEIPEDAPEPKQPVPVVEVTVLNMRFL